MTTIILKALISSCISCHGGDNLAQPYDGIPIIEGQNKTYLIRQMNAFKSGHRQQSTMNEVGKNLTQEQIEVLAEYFSKQGLPRIPPAVMGE